MKKICLIITILALSLNAAEVINIQAPGNLEVTNKLSCISVDEVKPSYSPADLFYGLSQCLDKSEYEKAAVLYSIAFAYGKYDSLRVVDKSAHQALSVMKFNLMNAKKEHIDKFQIVVTEKFKDRTKLCQELQGIQPPTYFPRYMIQHGIQALTQATQSNNGLIENFNVQDAWETGVKKGYLKCSQE